MKLPAIHDRIPPRGESDLRTVQDVAPDLRPRHPASPKRLLAFLAGVVLLKVVVSVVSNYHNYMPPNFASDFLQGRQSYFFGTYRWAFYAHILSGPVSLILGLFLTGERSRARFPKWHRYLGRIQVLCVLLLVAPSGLWMARYAAAGPVAGVGLATLAIATATCASLGAMAAMRRRFADHRRWMWRCFLLLCSAVVLRLIGGFASVVGVSAPWFDPAANSASWLVPLAVFEIRERLKRTPHLRDRDRAVRRRYSVSAR